MTQIKNQEILPVFYCKMMELKNRLWGLFTLGGIQNLTGQLALVELVLSWEAGL